MGKSHEKANLSKSIGYQYNIMKLSVYDEENVSLRDRALWWKTYHDHYLDEIRQLRGKIHTGVKK